jgi:hypothetical protein
MYDVRKGQKKKTHSYSYSHWNVLWKKSTDESEGKPAQKFDATFGTISRISKYFQRNKTKFGNRQAKKLKTICACTESRGYRYCPYSRVADSHSVHPDPAPAF